MRQRRKGELFNVLRVGGVFFWITVIFAAFVIGIAGSILVETILPTPAKAHDSWISRGGLKSPAGEWCCGDGDCGVMIGGTARAVPGGFEIDAVFHIEGLAQPDEHIRKFWPEADVMPSPDGAYWRCKWPDGSPRCRFAPRPGS